MPAIPTSREIETAYHTLTPLLGAAAAGIFLVSLIASGISASTVGTMAGQMIMQGFVGFRIPIWLRRLVTMVPAFVVVALGVNATNALVISQVVLEHRAAAADDLAADLHQQARHHGRVHQQPDNPRRGADRHGGGAIAQCRADRADAAVTRIEHREIRERRDENRANANPGLRVGNPGCLFGGR